MVTHSASVSRSANRVVRLLLAAVGVLIVAYAVSDHPFYGGEPGFGLLQKLIACAGVALVLCAFLPYRIAGNVLLLALASIAMLAIAEVAGEKLLGPRHRPVFQPDARLIFKFIPNRESVMTHAAINGGATVVHRINSQGFRGEELRPPGEMTRVAVYGDSFIHAFYTPDEQTFVAQFGRLLAGRIGRPVEAINAGVSSYGPDQVAVKLDDELGRLQPDLVLVAIFAGNDYGDLMRNKMFRLGADGGLAENPWRLDPKIRMWLELSQKESILYRAVRSALGRGPSAGRRSADVTGSDFLLAEATREYRSFVVEKNDIVVNTHVDYYSADISFTPDSESARYKVAQMRAVLGRIRDSTARHGVPLAFLFIPHPADVSDSDEWGMGDRRRFPRYDGRNLTAPLEEIAGSLGVPFLSLHDPFRSRSAAGLYLRGGDDHWNAAGQKLAAEAMVELLQRHGLPRTAGK